ncbi:ORC1-type DNA replication protein [Methanofollis fontis]|uniref:ORC1-type DNA replication protein n=1 Tax=Methanofollis fontis TaxID=2052832 RepID=A0A483CQU8_9EURY|nr:ORC1-type DNA replication protein [Methanofollis fontis]TAJ43610.1 orc1/cdc6 family replication initiation protein [Methanofollis fontis]
MTHHPLMADQTLFRDPDLFDADHLPETFHYRDTQMEALALSLRPALRGGSPLNTVLRGPPGTGKTTAARYIFAQVEETTCRVVPILVSCQAERTAHTVYTKLFTALIGHPPPSHGTSGTSLLAAVGRTLAERGTVLVVGLDDANYLAPKGVLNEVLARILRLHESYPGARTGVVMTDSSTDTDLSRVLDRATYSVLCPNEVAFHPYTAEEVRGILGDRLQVGVYPGVVPPAVLDLVVERTVACGDVRVGLHLLNEAVLHAERAGRTAVEVGDVEAAFAVARHTRLTAGVQTLAPQERAVLSVLAGMVRRGEETTSGRVYEAVAAVEPMCYTRFYERLKRLEALDLVTRRQRKIGQGWTREIVVREGVEEMVGPVPAGSSGASLQSVTGVAEDEKCRYEGGRG